MQLSGSRVQLFEIIAFLFSSVARVVYGGRNVSEWF